MKLDPNLFRIQARDEVQQLNFTFITAQTQGDFIITSPIGDVRTVTWNANPAVLMASIQQAYTELAQAMAGPTDCYGQSDFSHTVHDYLRRRLGQSEPPAGSRSVYG